MKTENETRTKSKTSSRRGNATQYNLRSKSESSATCNTTDDVFITHLKSSATPRPSTPSTPSSKICTVCRGLDELRNLKFKDTLSEFTNKIEIFKELTKSFNDNNSTLNHALDTIKHFILRLKPSEINDKFAEMDSSLNTLSSKVASLPDTSFFDSKLEEMAANLTNLNSKSIARLESKLDSLESKFTVLSSLNSKNHSFGRQGTDIEHRQQN